MTRANALNFVRAETDRMFRDIQADAGGINRFSHNRAPASVDHQTVIRMNRDTLYSFAVVDLADGATLVLPDAGERYLSVMVVSNDHLIDQIFHDAGTYELTAETAGSRYALVAVRILVDPEDAADVESVAALQDQLALEVGSAEPFVGDEWDAASLDATRGHLLGLADGLNKFDGAFGSAREIDPILHLIGTAAGWGGLPTSEAIYVGFAPGLPVGSYELTVGDVPVDGFWSVAVYNAEGYFEPNPAGAYSINSVTAVPDPDGRITVRFGEHPEGAANVIPIPEGWNYLVRLYRPRPEVVDGTWTFPTLVS